MFGGIILWFKSLFTKEWMGILLQKLFLNAAKDFTKEIFNGENQEKAYEFVKELHKRDDITNLEKAAIFNKKMAEWAAKCGKVLTTSILNCLREMAVNVLKDELGKKIS